MSYRLKISLEKSLKFRSGILMLRTNQEMPKTLTRGGHLSDTPMKGKIITVVKQLLN